MAESIQAEVLRLLEAADLNGAREFLVRAIQQRPDAAWPRWLLFEVNSLRGAWETAQAQTATLVVLDPRRAAVYETYGQLAACMLNRAAVWRGEQVPRCTDTSWLRWERRMKVLAALQGGELEVLAELHALDEGEGGGIRGRQDGSEFHSCRDRDVRLAFGFETIISGEYWWLRSCEILRIQAAGAGRRLRDQVWRPALITLKGGQSHQAFLPVRYPGTEVSAEPPVVLGRETVFRQHRCFEVGQGMHVLQFNDGVGRRDVPLNQIHNLEFTPPSAE